MWVFQSTLRPSVMLVISERRELKWGGLVAAWVEELIAWRSESLNSNLPGSHAYAPSCF